MARCLYCSDAWQYHRPGIIHGKAMPFQKTGGDTDFVDMEIWLQEGEVPCLMAYNTAGRGAYVDIGYCPMCGKRLRTGKKGSV